MRRPAASRALRRRASAGGLPPISARLLALVLPVIVAGPLALATPGAAQTLGDQLKPKTDKNEKMLVEANELVQDTKANTVSAVGNVRIYYNGRTLEADKVVYDKNTKRLLAVGHAKITEKDGTVYRGDKFNLTSDFRDGFADSLRSDQVGPAGATHYSAPRMERVGGNTTVFTKGTYTACDACKDNPDKPPLWRVRAKRIIHQNDEQMIYYEDTYLEFFGVPVAYSPYLSAPDPSVKKKSGVLSPKTFYKSTLGYGVGVPIFFNLAPDYDLTLTPTAFTNQGFFGAGEFRQRFSNGQYYIRATGINQLNPNAFFDSPYGSGRRDFRWDVTTKGEFQINERWKFGWNIAILSDKFYLYDYSIPTDTYSSNYFSESISTVYLTGQSERSYFDLRGYYIQGLTSFDIQKQQPVAAPVLDYNRVFDIDPAKTRGIGGQVEVDFNLTSLSAQQASFQSVGARTLDSAYGLYDICRVYQPGRTPGNSCLLRGIGGDYTRATGQVTYQRKYIDAIGEVWTPFAFARVNGETLNLNQSGVFSFQNGTAGSTYSNAAQDNFLPGGSGTTGYVVPGVGLEWRYPFMTRMPFGSVIAEPIAQVVARPNRVLGSDTRVNLDAQSLVFDSTNLFDWNKFSGYDRFETGTRANYGGQFSLNFNNGGYARFQAGQSAQLAGSNAYATPDMANIGLSSGLDTRRSDYVTGATFSPFPFISIGGQGRFDVATLTNRRVDATVNLNFGKLTGGAQFANYQAQPVIGYDVRREGLALFGRYDFADHYFAQGNVTFDMSRHLYPTSVVGYDKGGPFTPAALGVGLGYTDECASFAVNYTSLYQDNGIGLQRNQVVLVSLSLRTLGDAAFSKSSINGSTGQTLDSVR